MCTLLNSYESSSLLHSALNLHDLLSGLMYDLWTRELPFTNLNLADRAYGELLKRRIYRSDLKPFLTNSNLVSLLKVSDYEDETIPEENAHPKVVSADDAIPAGVSIFASDVAAAVVSPQSETEFAFMGLSTEVSMSVRTKQGLGLDKYVGKDELGIDDSKVSIFYTNSDDLEGQPIYNRFASVDHIKAVPPPLTGNYMPPSNIPDIDESQMVCRKKATDSSEIKTNNDSISYSHNSVLFDFSDRSSKPSTNDFQTCDSSVTDFTDSISSVSVPASKYRDIIVIDCDRHKDFPSVCSIETDVKSSKTLYCNLHEQRFAKRNAKGKGILGRRPIGKPVNLNRPTPVSAGQQKPVFVGHQNPVFAGPPNPVSTEQQNTVFAGPPNPVSAGQPNPVSAGQPNPVSAGEATLACNSIPLSVSAGDGILGPRPLNIQPKSWPWKKFGMSKTKRSKINGGSKSKSRSYAKGPLGRPKSEMTWETKNKLEDFEDFDGGEVTFGGSKGKILGKGTIKTKTLNFKNVLYVEELQYFNLISISQICDQTHRVLFTENECLVLSKDFPLPDPSMTESTLWNRRLGHVNFKNMNKLVKGNLVRGLPSKNFKLFKGKNKLGKEEADQLGLAFPSLNPILGVGSAPIGSFTGSTPPVSPGSTPLMSLCASLISTDRHSISAGKCHVSAGRPTGSAGRPVSASKPTGSAGRPSGSAARTPVPAVCAAARHQVTPKTSNLLSVKRIFKYLTTYPKLGLWYPQDSLFDLEAFSDSDYAGAHGDTKSTTGGCQFLGRRLISWQCKKQTIVATSSCEAEYVAAASCCGQRTKHIETRHHFIRDANEKKLIQVLKIPTQHNVADLLTKSFDVTRFGYLVVNIDRGISSTWYMRLFERGFCCLRPILVVGMVSAGGHSFSLVAVVSLHFCWSCDFLLVVPHSCWCLGFCWSYVIPAGNVFFLLVYDLYCW
nr:hypothetical protein [Tanacetum cinerariifolium]